MWKFQHNPTIFLGGRAHKLHKKGHFMKAASIQKHLKIYNFTTIDVILMKLTRIMYLCNSFLLTGTWAVTQKQHSTTEKHLKGSQKISFLTHFWPILKITIKNFAYLMRYLPMHYWLNFETDLSTFPGVRHWKPPRSSLKWCFLLVQKHFQIENSQTTRQI